MLKLFELTELRRKILTLVFYLNLHGYSLKIIYRCYICEMTSDFNEFLLLKQGQINILSVLDESSSSKELSRSKPDGHLIEI